MERYISERLNISSLDAPIISSRRNPLVRRLRLISRKEGIEQHSMLLLEGTHLLQEALRTDYFPKEIVATTFWLNNHHEILESISEKTQIIEVTKSVLEAALTTVTPDGVAALFPVEKLPSLPKNPSFVLALDRVQDPGNMGNLFRTALAADVECLWLASGAHPLSQKVIRSSVGAVLHMPFDRFGSNEKQSLELLEKKLQFAVEKGFQVVGTSSQKKQSSHPINPYWEIDWEKPTVLVLGNEGSGLDADIQNCCTKLITLPHSSNVESLNVAAAAVPLLFERRRAKMMMGMQ